MTPKSIYFIFFTCKSIRHLILVITKHEHISVIQNFYELERKQRLILRARTPQILYVSKSLYCLNQEFSIFLLLSIANMFIINKVMT